ncbi:MAG: hypothetical protein H6Q00_194 [Holophagaceae bacterium]|nr:hypothetical protein [Holophagaceae bacterium]
MKVLIVGFANIYVMPYLHFYLKFLQERGCKVHLFYWDRDGGPDQTLPVEITTTKFEYHLSDHLPRWKKIKAFWTFRKECGNLLDSEDFDFILILTTLPAFLLSSRLKKRFRKNYIMDFRDLTLEKSWIFRSSVRRLMAHAAATFISSDGFRKYYPDAKLQTTHNILLDTLDHRDVRRQYPRETGPIRIRFWGLIRHEEINIKIIRHLSKDPRFELHYHGRETQVSSRLKAYAERNHANNVFFHGAYQPGDRYGFASQTELLHNIYENDEATRPAMGNKFYDGIALYLPQLCHTGSHMGDEVIASRVGLACDPSHAKFADVLFDHYQTIDWSAFESHCDQKLRKILEEYQAGLGVLDTALMKRHRSHPGS